MLDEPKGLKYWIEKDGELTIRDDAPEWAKEEFKEYKELLSSIGEPDEDGLIKL